MTQTQQIVDKIVTDGEALALEFEHKAATRRSVFARWWYRRAARSIRKDLNHIYKQDYS